ncbi:MAG: hypothetical protein IKJ01_10005 [Lachnospiraceae bacterium]|nr:hypothetical protein [Lachnospiraceae bacterium]
MFHNEQKLKYQDIKAPEELKERTWLSIEQHKRNCRMMVKKVTMTVAACVAVLCISGQLLQKDNRVSVNETILSTETLEIPFTELLESTPALVEYGRKQSLLIQIPMEIAIKEKANICVSDGILQIMDKNGVLLEQSKVVEISESQLIYWCIDVNTIKQAECILKTGEKEITYLLEIDSDTKTFIITQKK